MQPKQTLPHYVIAYITLSFLLILLLGYAGIFRISEILDIRVKDVGIFDDFMTINLLKRKNDQMR